MNFELHVVWQKYGENNCGGHIECKWSCTRGNNLLENDPVAIPATGTNKGKIVDINEKEGCERMETSQRK